MSHRLAANPFIPKINFWPRACVILVGGRGEKKDSFEIDGQEEVFLFSRFRPTTDKGVGMGSAKNRHCDPPRYIIIHGHGRMKIARQHAYGHMIIHDQKNACPLSCRVYVVWPEEAQTDNKNPWT